MFPQGFALPAPEGELEKKTCLFTKFLPRRFRGALAKTMFIHESVLPLRPKGGGNHMTNVFAAPAPSRVLGSAREVHARIRISREFHGSREITGKQPSVYTTFDSVTSLVLAKNKCFRWFLFLPRRRRDSKKKLAGLRSPCARGGTRKNHVSSQCSSLDAVGEL